MLTTQHSGRMVAFLILSSFLFAACEAGWEPTETIDMDPEAIEPVELANCAGFQPMCAAACNVLVEPIEATCVNGHWECVGGVEASNCPNYSGLCAADKPCGYGYSCVQSAHHPVPAEQGTCRKGDLKGDARLENCADWGTLWPEQLIDNHQSLVGRVIKFAARVGVTVKCNDSACFGGSNCCGNCVGNYAAELKQPFGHNDPLRVLIQTEGLACAGNPCDVSCAPLTVGETYRMWGVLSDCSGVHQCTFLLMGACPL